MAKNPYKTEFPVPETDSADLRSKLHLDSMEHDVSQKPHPPEVAAAFALMHAERAARRALVPTLQAEGIAALRRLLPIAQSDTGQSRRIAAFLLGLYNGDRFRFDLTELRGLDYALHDDCLAVLRMDKTLEKEVHHYFERGGEIFERLADDWGFEKTVPR